MQGNILACGRIVEKHAAHITQHYSQKCAKSVHSPTGNRTRVAWVKTTYPDQLDYRGRQEGEQTVHGLARETTTLKEKKT